MIINPIAYKNADIEQLSVTENDTYIAPSGVDGYNPVVVNVPTGGFSPPEGIEIGIFTPSDDVQSVTIPHSFGEVPKMAICVAQINSAWDQVTLNRILLETLASSPASGEFSPDAPPAERMNTVVSYNTSANSYLTTNTYTTYPAAMTTEDVTFATGRYYNGTFTSGAMYVYLIIK